MLRRDEGTHTKTDHFRQLWVLLEELYHAVGQLCLVLDKSLGLVQGDQHLGQELLVLCLQGKGKAVDDASQDLQELGHAVKLLSLVNKPEKVSWFFVCLFVCLFIYLMD